MAGLTLGSISSTLERLPGLLVLVPAAIGLRGTIFGAMGSRLGTSIHTGTFSTRVRTETVLGQNVLAAGVLTLVTAVVLAVLAKAFAVGFGIPDSISVADLLVISFLAAVISSLVLVVFTVALAAASIRYRWDPDNVMAPLVTATGDLITLPTLYLATLVLDNRAVVTVVSVVAVGAAVVSLVLALRSRLAILKQILRESLAVVIVAGALSLVAGLTLEGRLDTLAETPALLALVPAFLASAGSLGGILSNRLTSRLHLGTIEPTTFPSGRDAARHHRRLPAGRPHLRPGLGRGGPHLAPRRPGQPGPAGHGRGGPRGRDVGHHVFGLRRVLRRRRLVPGRDRSRQRRHPAGHVVDRPGRIPLVHHRRRPAGRRVNTLEGTPDG